MIKTDTHGICIFSIIPMRKEASHQSELVSQLLFGDAYGVVSWSQDLNWISIKTPYDEYTGWIDARQHHAVSEAYFMHWTMKPQSVCMDDVAYIEANDRSSLVLLGSTLPMLTGRKIQLGDLKFDFQGDLVENVALNEAYIQFIAMRYMHTPYLWGGKTLFGIDCSGFVQMVFKILGFRIFRDAYQQAQQGHAVHLDDTRTGDLAFFENEQGKITHVGLVLDQKRIIHAHGHVRIDIVDEKGILNLTTKKYSHKFSHCRRILDY